MRHVIVKRVSALLALVVLAAAAVFVRIVTPAHDGSQSPAATPRRSGAALFETHCGSCHAVDDLRAALSDRSETRRVELERFLADHGDANPDEDRAILDYLSGRLDR